MNPRVFTKNAKEESEYALDKTDDSAAFFVRLDRQQPPRSSPAGATFPTPLYTRWFNTYARVDSGVEFNYQSIGSGGGIAQIIDRKVD
jgi:ABC-type phosphate transport system substrate-binding protein